MEELDKVYSNTGYPVYKLIRAVNRQYPNNGFINNVDVREDMYDSDDPEKSGIIDEDLRDLINEAISETYINIARDEVYTFPTVPGQKEYVLPEDCDLRDVQEVVRRWAPKFFVPPPKDMTNVYTITFYPDGGSGVMEPIQANIGTEVPLPGCTFIPPEGKEFKCWDVDGVEMLPGTPIKMEKDVVATAVWENKIYLTLLNVTPGGGNTKMTVVYQVIGEDSVSEEINSGESVVLDIPNGEPLETMYYRIAVFDRDDQLNADVYLADTYTESATLRFTQHADTEEESDDDEEEHTGHSL